MFRVLEGYELFYAVLSLHTVHSSLVTVFLCTFYFTLLSGWFSFSLWQLVLTHTYVIPEFWSINLISCDSVIYSVAPSQYILLCLQSFRVYEGPISSDSHIPHCHMSTMDVFCISKVFNCFYDNKNVFDLTWLTYRNSSVQRSRMVMLTGNLGFVSI